MKRVALIGNVASMMVNFRGYLIKDLSDRGVRVFCFCVDYDEESRAKIRVLGGEPVDFSLNSKGLNPFLDFFATFDLYKKLKSEKFDVVMPYFVKPVLFGGLAAKLAGVPRVVGMIEGLGNAFVEYDEFSLKRSLIKWMQILLYKVLLRNLDCLLLLNESDKLDLIDKYKIKVKKVVVLGGIGVDLNEFSYVADLSIKAKSVGFIFVARLLREKGIFEFLEAAKQIKGEGFDAEFVVLGGFDESVFALSREDMDGYTRSGIVKYPGFVNNVKEWVSGSSVFVLPSFYREGVPRSTQEAMALGKPVITTNVPGCRDTVEDGVNGFLIPPKDVSSLVVAMKRFLENPELIDVMGLASRSMAVSKFDVDAVNERIISILQGK